MNSMSHSQPVNAVSILEAHAVYLSDQDEAEVIQRAVEDVGELALRTCLCGARIDGFDSYTDHLREVLVRSV